MTGKVGLSRRPRTPASVAAKTVKARWAYSELGSSRVGALYHGYQPGLRLRDKAISGEAFETLDAADIGELTFMYEGVRGRYLFKYLEARSFEKVSLGKADLNHLFVLPEMVECWPVSIIQWAMQPASPDPYDVKTLLNATKRGSLNMSEMPPATVGIHDGTLLLVDGYFRVLLFLRDSPWDETFDVYVPTL